MALHGTIGINGDTIAAWSARRTESLKDGRAGYEYECEFRWIRDGLRLGVQRFNLGHLYEDGAAILAAKVMTAAQSSADGGAGSGLGRAETGPGADGSGSVGDGEDG